MCITGTDSHCNLQESDITALSCGGKAVNPHSIALTQLVGAMLTYTAFPNSGAGVVATGPVTVTTVLDRFEMQPGGLH